MCQYIPSIFYFIDLLSVFIVFCVIKVAKCFIYAIRKRWRRFCNINKTDLLKTSYLSWLSFLLPLLLRRAILPL